MKRKLFAGMFAAIGMMLAISCSNDETLNLSSNESQVRFSLGLESGINTRAISDGTGINQLHFAIFDSEGNSVESSEGQEVSFPFNTEISLVKGQQYTAVFWAQNKACTAYTVSEDLKTITVDYSAALNNDETRDAFFKSETFTVTDNTNLNVVLKRPFAQLNVGITEEEWNESVALGVTITKSEVEIKQAATTLNLIDGTVGTPMDVTFKANAIPTEALSVDANTDGTPETYKYLSMSYFLANDATTGSAKATLDDLTFTFTDENGNEVVFDKGLDNAPVQRNHRTNIITLGEGGGILTNDVDVKVTIDPLYDGEHTFTDTYVWEEYKGIYTEEAMAGMTIEMPAGWHIRNGYILEPLPEYWTSMSNPTPLYSKPYTVDGKDNTVTFEPYDYQFVAKNAFAATNSALVTVKNLNFAGEHFGVFGGVYGAKNYKTAFEKINVVDNGIYCYNKSGDTPVSAFINLGEATLNSCVIKGTYWVGAEKDKNTFADKALNDYEGVYDVFVPNDGVTIINNSTIGNVYVKNHGILTISGTSDATKSEIEKIVSHQLVKGKITIKEYVNVDSIYVDQFSASYPPKVTIEAGASVGTLQLNSIVKTNIIIDSNATVGKIIWKGVEYTSIAAFNAAS